MITLEKYNSMKLEDRIELLICEGEYIDTIEKFDYETWLYVLDGIYIEVVYSIPFNKIEDVRVVNDPAALEAYLDWIDVKALVA